jgi:starch-binding outer membrane protein, SusD/RagB family
MKNRNIIFLTAIILVITGCKKFVDPDPPINQISSALVFSSEQTAKAAITGMYARFLNSNPDMFDGYLSIYSGLSADDLARTSANTNEDQYYNNALLSTNTTISSTWTRLYQYIYQANACIEGLAASTALSDSLKRQYTGEAKFLRAFEHFYLVNLFGNAPLITSTDYSLNQHIGRTKKTDVETQIINDLKDAVSLLSTSYPVTERIRVNKWAASALLARVYLYQKDYVNAEAQATAVINSGMYGLVTNLNNVFLSTSNEAIWMIRPTDAGTRATAEGSISIPATTASTKPTYILTSSLLSSFELNDQRKTSWTANKVVSAVTYTYPFKFKIKTKTAGAQATEYIMPLRLSEQYLIRAEARAQQNNISGAQADLNLVRNRAGLLPTTASTQAALLSAIIQENRVEFFAEWGHRWLDLKRLGLADAVLGTLKGSNWQSTDVLYPIPNSQILANSTLSQNPGY